MKIITLALLSIISIIAVAQKKAVEITYSQPDVYVVMDEQMVGINPKTIKIDFAIGGDLYFFKRGCYSQRVTINPDKPFGKLNVNLVEKPESAALARKQLLKPDTLKLATIVTNMTANDIQEIVNETFAANNYYVGNSISMFPGASDDIANSKYFIAIEVIESNQVRTTYKSPYFLMASIKMRWSLLDKSINKVMYYNTTEGTYFVPLETTKNISISDKMKRVVKEAIVESQTKLITDPSFTKIIANE